MTPTNRFLVLTLFLLTATAAFNVWVGIMVERDRLYTKCLTEHEALPHKDAVVLCKERVK